MRTIMARSTHESSFSFSRRHLQWIVRKVSGEGARDGGEGESEEEILSNCASSVCHEETAAAVEKKKKSPSAVTKLGSVIKAAVAGKKRASKVIVTMFGQRRGHIHFAFQLESRSAPTTAVLIELAMPTSTLLKEMASGLVRIALECERRGYGSAGKSKPGKLLEETLWRAYCNGKKCGYAVRRDCGPEDCKVLKAVEPVSMGAGVLPAINGDGDGGAEGETMYMRAKFERVVGSKDSEAFYMMNPDGNSGPELSIYLLRA